MSCWLLNRFRERRVAAKLESSDSVLATEDVRESDWIRGIGGDDVKVGRDGGERNQEMLMNMS